MNDNKDISKIEDIIKALSLKDFENSANSLSEAQKENIKLGKKTLSDYGGVVLSPLTKEAIEIKRAYLNDEINDEQYLDWVKKHDMVRPVNEGIFQQQDEVYSLRLLKGENLVVVKDADDKYIADNIQHYELCDAGIFHEDMDKLISRSEKPELIKQLCEEYDPAAFENCKTYAEFFEAMEEMSVYVGFKVDAFKKDPPVVTAYIDINLPNERISLGQIPLTESETDYVLKAVDRCKEIEVEKLQHDVYEAYKDEWLSENVSAVMQEEAEKEYEEYEEEYASFDDYIEENGYRGSLYVCFEEFIAFEYQDKGWLRNHFKADEAVFLAKNDYFFPFLVYDMNGTTWKDDNSVSVLDSEIVIDVKETKGKSKERD